MKKTSTSHFVDLDFNVGTIGVNLKDLEGATMLFDDILSDLEDYPEISAEYVAKGIITKKLRAINSVLKHSISDSNKEMESAQKLIEDLSGQFREESVSYLAEIRKSQTVDGKPLTIKKISQECKVSARQLADWELHGVPGATDAQLVICYSKALKVPTETIMYFSKLQRCELNDEN